MLSLLLAVLATIQLRPLQGRLQRDYATAVGMPSASGPCAPASGSLLLAMARHRAVLSLVEAIKKRKLMSIQSATA